MSLTSPPLAEAASLTVPAELPVPVLSVSSLQRFWRCPEQWRRHYLLGEREPVTGAMVLGSAVGQAIAHFFAARLAGARISAVEARESFHHAWELAAEGAVFDGADDDARRRTADALRDRGDAVLAAYLASPLVAQLEREEVVAIEPRHELCYPGAEWTLIAYLDLVTARGTIVDLKVTGRHRTPADARRDVQARAYVLARRLAEPDGPAPRFAFHSLRHGATPQIRAVPAEPMQFTDGELAAFERRLALTARSIAASVRSGDWAMASPMGWWCSERCAAWSTCPGGLGDATATGEPVLPLAA